MVEPSQYYSLPLRLCMLAFNNVLCLLTQYFVLKLPTAARTYAPAAKL
jgi:antibiotic biosynthesis monooxygenase (ABM) superfamily enzyme